MAEESWLSGKVIHMRKGREELPGEASLALCLKGQVPGIWAGKKEGLDNPVLSFGLRLFAVDAILSHISRVKVWAQDLHRKSLELADRSQREVERAERAFVLASKLKTESEAKRKHRQAATAQIRSHLRSQR